MVRILFRFIYVILIDANAVIMARLSISSMSQQPVVNRRSKKISAFVVRPLIVWTFIAKRHIWGRPNTGLLGSNQVIYQDLENH